MSSKKFAYCPELDGLRAFAVLIVVVAHGSIRLAPETLRNGWVGVTIFFVLSGYLITQILLLEKQRTGHLDLPAFVFRRGLRIWPLYFIVLLVYAIILPNIDARIFGHVYVDAEDKSFLTYWNSLWPHVVFLQNYLVHVSDVRLGLGIYWSLAVEEHFYLVWPLAVVFLNNRYLKILLVAACLVSIAMRFMWIDPMVPRQMIGHTTHTNIAALGLGCMLAIFNVEGRLPERINKPLWIGTGVSLLLFALSIQWLGSIPWPGRLAYLASVSGAVILVATCNYQNAFLRIPALVRIGKISFGMYMLHPLVLGLISNLAGPGIRGNPLAAAVGILAVVLASWGLAELSYRFMETPFLKLKSRYSRI